MEDPPFGPEANPLRKVAPRQMRACYLERQRSFAIGSGDSMRFQLATLLSAALLAGCAGASSAGSGALSTEEVCSTAESIAAIEATLPVLTQCEFQDSAGRTVFVLQFDDPAQNEYVEALAPSRATTYDEPLASLLDVWDKSRAVRAADAYIVSFRDQCQTVWEIPSEVMDDALSGSISMQQMTDRMQISTLTAC